MSVAGGGGEGGLSVKVPNAATGFAVMSVPENAASRVAVLAWIWTVTLIVAVVRAASVPSGQVTARTPRPPAPQLPCVGCAKKMNAPSGTACVSVATTLAALIALGVLLVTVMLNVT